MNYVKKFSVCQFWSFSAKIYCKITNKLLHEIGRNGISVAHWMETFSKLFRKPVSLNGILYKKNYYVSVLLFNTFYSIRKLNQKVKRKIMKIGIITIKRHANEKKNLISNTRKSRTKKRGTWLDTWKNRRLSGATKTSTDLNKPAIHQSCTLHYEFHVTFKL